MGLSSVQVVYLSPPEEIVLEVELRAGDTLEQLIARSGLFVRCPQIEPTTSRVGVFGQLREWTSTAQPGDRIEIYRPLLADPKAARRQRAAKKARAFKR